MAFFKRNNLPKEIFVPLLLPIDRPLVVPKFPMDECLLMIFEVKKALPPNIVSRLVVQRHEDIVVNFALWRKGAVLHYRKGNAMALVVEDVRTITVEVKGKDKTPYIAELRDTLKGIFETYKEVNPSLLYRLVVSDELNQGEPYLARENVILKHYQKGRPILNENTDEDMPTESTVFDYNLINSSNNIIIVNQNHGDSTTMMVPQVTMNKQKIERWMRDVIKELKKNNIQDKELINAVKSLITFLKAPIPDEVAIKKTLGVIQSIGTKITAKGIWEVLMHSLPF